jgi:hypothetical protein
MTLSEPAIAIPHQKLITARSGEARNGEDAFFANVNSELSDKGFRSAPGSCGKSIRERQVDVLNLHHRQLIETALICPEAIS